MGYRSIHLSESAGVLHLSMTVSMRVIGAGDGHKDLLRSGAAAGCDRSLSTQLTRYHAQAGTPSSV